MSLRSHIVTVGICLVTGATVLYLIHRKKLKEQYALAWIGICVVMIVLASWRSLLEWIAEALGIYYAPSVLFLLGMALSFVLLLHFSVAMTRLYRDNARMAVRLAELELSRVGDRSGTARSANDVPLFDQEAGQKDRELPMMYLTDPRD